MYEKLALTVGSWLLFAGGALGLVVGAAWFFTGARPFAEYASAGLGGAATITASALVAFLRGKL